MKQYSERQIEAANLLNSVSQNGEEFPSDVLDEVVSMIGEAEEKPPDTQAPKEKSIDLIKMRLLDEQDWRKRASLAAMIISKGLE